LNSKRALRAGASTSKCYSERPRGHRRGKLPAPSATHEYGSWAVDPYGRGDVPLFLATGGHIRGPQHRWSRNFSPWIHALSSLQRISRIQDCRSVEYRSDV